MIVKGVYMVELGLNEALAWMFAIFSVGILMGLIAKSVKEDYFD